MSTLEEDVKVLAIANDRVLLEKLHLSNVEAARYLGRSRQAVHNKLSRNPRDYFSLGEIVFLVHAARSQHASISDQEVEDIVEYVEHTRGTPESAPFRLFEQLMRAETQPIDVTGASGIVMLLPNLPELRKALPEVASGLFELVANLPTDAARPKVFVISPTQTQAAIAARWLGLEDESSYFADDLVDHYGPTILVYRQGKGQERDEAIPYVLSGNDTFEAASRLRRHQIADCVSMMLPAEIAAQLRNRD